MIIGRNANGTITTKTDGGLRAVECACCSSCPIPNNIREINFVTSGITKATQPCVTPYFNGSWKIRRTDDPRFFYACFASASESSVEISPPRVDPTSLPYTIACTQAYNDADDACISPCYTNNISIVIAQYPKGNTPEDGFLVSIRFSSFRTFPVGFVFVHEVDGKFEAGKAYPNQLPYGGTCTLSW
jgi:hypothetical protein